jgi:hypothetical protein
MKPEETTEAPPPVDDNIINLDTPIIRGKTYFTSLTLRKPNSGELRGVHLAELLNLDVSSLIKVLPRISSPALTTTEAAAMDPADLFAIGTKIVGFLLQKQTKTDAYLVA